MNVTKPEKEGIGKKGIIIYGIIIFICVVSLLVAFYVQFYKRIDLGKLIGINQEEKYGNKTEDETSQIEAEFLNIFNNSIENKDNISYSNKIEEDKDIIYTQFETKEIKNNNYDIEVYVPKINIQNETVDGYNKEIKQVFIDFVDMVKQSENRNIIYSVDYTANIQNGILSVIIHSNFKDGTKAQKVIIKTYNYDLRNNKEITLEEVLKFEQVSLEKIQSIINTKIELEQKKVKDLQDLGYSIFKRDIKNEMYKIENTDNFYIKDNIIYVIYPYGNKAETSEMDLVIL